MDKRTVILLLVMFLGLGAYLFFIYGKEGSSFAFGESNFAIKDTAALTRLTLTRVVQGEEKLQINLKRENQSWIVNSKYVAFQPRVNQMLETLTKLEIREPLSDAAKETGLKFFDALHTRLDAYENGKKVKSILIGTQTKDAKGTVMMLSGRKSPYVLEIPGLPGYLNVYFPMELNVWRENLLFLAKREKINSFEVRYDTLNGELDFLWTQVNQDPKIDGQDADNEEAYFSNFKGKIFAETFAGADFPNVLNKLKLRTPDISINIKYVDKGSRSIYLYKRPENPNNYFAWISGIEELITVQTYVIDKFLLTKSDFLKNEGV